MAALAIILVTGATLLAMSVFAAMFIGPYVIAWFLGRKLRDVTSQKDSRGRSVQMTALGRTGYANLPMSIGFVAGLGTDATPQQTTNTLILRPTWGVRMTSLVFSALLIYIAYVGYGELVPASPYTWPVIGLLLVYGVLSTWIYELRYDRDGFVTTGFLRSRKEMQWRDLAQITDNGHYLYALKTFDGQKVEVQKYLVGIREFLTYARDQMAYHDRH